ncbi:zinc-binding metallopeptidase family protein [Nocardioides iriomotensis]|uniref:Zinc-ribbon domain-containing protein n=1 Tax=Nocardioides iriomotensis TaxID=715784 RepID=A0A4V1Z1H9_9ACTN|nr:putative zinc-binding metallopeptidase [Nocardioides iriomotensis]RYU10966.1 hypothetical protein ETU37_14740 [Nocardioides iriomotensis]
MRAFSCDTCGEQVYFDNTICLSCDSPLGWSRAEQRITVVPDDDTRCSQRTLNGCNWIVATPGLCDCCALTRTRPADHDVVGLPQYYVAEQAKRRLVAELDALGLPVAPRDAQGRGLAFDLLSSVEEHVVTGHADGVVTIDLAESDDVHRERVRLEMGEAYRTMLGHLRHEIGHYYEMLLVADDATRAAARDLFGDETADYQEAVDRHYADGPPVDWPERYVSAYATMHPFEDFAETFAHVLHVRDGLETAHAHGLTGDPRVAERPFAEVVLDTWLPLTRALNQMNRSMGQGDLYPFVLSAPVVDKLAYVHHLVTASSRSEP